MKQILTFIALMNFLACSTSQTFELSNNIEQDIKELLPEGIMRFDVMDKVRQSPRQNELTEKFQRSIRENYDWFLEYSSTMEPGKPMPYHENLGLTEEEYAELQTLMSNIELISSGVIEYRIIHDENLLTLIPLDTVNNHKIKIDFKKNIVVFDNQALSFKDTLRISESQNGFKSEWFGYQWLYENPSDLKMSALKDLGSIEMEQYKFTVGFIERTKKTYVQIKGREMAHGIKTIDYEFPLIEKK